VGSKFVKVVLIIVVLLIAVSLYFTLLLTSVIKLNNCRNYFGKPEKTGIIKNETYDTDNPNISYVQVRTCVSGKEKNGDIYFLDLSFFDNYWLKKTFKSALGDETSLIGYCYSTNCTALSSSKIFEVVNKGDLLDVYIITKDSKAAISDYFMRVDYKTYVDSFVKAITSGRGFLSKSNFPLYISQISVWPN
jgi:hypothetical protein